MEFPEIQIDDLLKVEPFSQPKSQKREILARKLNALTRHHVSRCEPYRKMAQAQGYKETLEFAIEDLPILPARLFKSVELLSVERQEVFKRLYSSSTTDDQPAKIFLNRHTASDQSKVILAIMQDVLGKKRLPMLIVDSAAFVGDRRHLSARNVGAIGFSILGKNLTYALDADFNLDIAKVESFLGNFVGQELLVFGLTHMIWEKLSLGIVSGARRLSLANATLIHGGGWKKLSDRAVRKADFAKILGDSCGITRIHNYYGMVEQSGSIFVECESGHLHASIYSDVIVRDENLSQVEFGRIGLLQVLSLLPKSYPGHILLTEDEGRILGEDDCTCGRLGKYFQVIGRAKSAELRGCSDAVAR